MTDDRVEALRRNPESIETLGQLLAAKTGDPGYLADETYELQIHDQNGPDLCFECSTEEEARAILGRDYPPRRGLDWVIIDPSGAVIDGTR